MPLPRALLPARPGRLLLTSAILASLAACGGGDDATMEATPEDIDQETPVSVTEEELAAFRAPSDSALSEAQLTAFLRTSLLQYDLIRQERAGLAERLATMEEREQEGGMLNQLNNLATAGQTMFQLGDLVGGSYVRAARTLGHNPAEMEWVRERMGEVSGHLMMKPMLEQSLASAAEFRTQAEQLRAQAASAGDGAELLTQQADQMLEMAVQMEANAQQAAPGAVGRNIDLLARARPAVTEEMWSAVGFAAGAQGLLLLSGLDDPNSTEVERKLDEFRDVYQGALENRAVQATTQPQ